MMNARTRFSRLSTRRGLLCALAALLAVPLSDACAGFVNQLHVVEISDEKGYRPDALAIRTGDTVRWKNLGIHPHTVTTGSANGGGSGAGQAFDSGDILPGRTWSYTFATPGQYQYASADDQGRPFQGTIAVNG